MSGVRGYFVEREGDWRCFQFKVARTFRKSLLRQIWEAVEIHGSKATIILNSKAEWHQPVVDRVVVTREPPEQQGGGRRGRRQGGGAYLCQLGNIELERESERRGERWRGLD